MKNNINYSPEAIRDLDEIWEYIAFEFCNVDAAERIVSRIMDTVERLENFAYTGAMLSSIVDIKSDYRYLVCGDYMAFYRVSEKNIYIDRVLYGKRNYLKVLFPDMSQKDDEN